MLAHCFFYAQHPVTMNIEKAKRASILSNLDEKHCSLATYTELNCAESRVQKRVSIYYIIIFSENVCGIINILNANNFFLWFYLFFHSLFNALNLNKINEILICTFFFSRLKRHSNKNLNLFISNWVFECFTISMFFGCVKH